MTAAGIALGRGAAVRIVGTVGTAAAAVAVRDGETGMTVTAPPAAAVAATIAGVGVPVGVGVGGGRGGRAPAATTVSGTVPGIGTDVGAVGVGVGARGTVATAADGIARGRRLGARMTAVTVGDGIGTTGVTGTVEAGAGAGAVGMMVSGTDKTAARWTTRALGQLAVVCRRQVQLLRL